MSPARTVRHPSLRRRVRWEIVEASDGFFTVSRDGREVARDVPGRAKAVAVVKRMFTDGDSVLYVMPNGAQQIITRTVRGG